MKTKTLSLSFLFLIILSTVALAQAQLSLNLTVSSDKAVYNFYDPISISGTLQFNGINPSDGLVAIEIPYSTGGIPFILRTIQTGTTTVFNLPEKITSAYSSDQGGGNQVGTFMSGSNGYFTATVNDQDNTVHNAVLAISIYDGNGVPLGLYYSTFPIGAGATQTATASIPIPTSAHSGTAYGYADVFSDLPQNGGTPMAQEQPFQFTISARYPSKGPAPSNSGNAGAYSMTFTVPKNFLSGTYNVYTSSKYNGFQSTATTSFTVTLLGDFNGDGKVDSNDLFAFVDSYIKYYQGQAFNPLCDINHDGKVDSADFFLFLAAYIQYWSP